MQSFTLILVSEIGDKTFLIAAIMATRHPRMTVFGGAFASLLVMSVLSAAMGKVILGLIPAVSMNRELSVDRDEANRALRHSAEIYPVCGKLLKQSKPIVLHVAKLGLLLQAAFLFLVFGIRMIQEGLAIPAGNNHIQEEMREVEDELEEEEGMMDFHGRQDALEMEEGISRDKASATKKGPTIHTKPHPLSAPRKSSTTSGSTFKDKLKAADLKNRTRNFCSLFFSPVFAQAFILTFLGEWGDRSQIATIALAGANVSRLALGNPLANIEKLMTA